MTIVIGSTATLTHVVQEQDLATHWQNDVEVLATPILLWLSEVACIKAMEGQLADSVMTVGTGHEMKHLAPTPPGCTVKITATLINAEGHKLLFEVVGDDGYEQIVQGYHMRMSIVTQQFLARVQKKRTLVEQQNHSKTEVSEGSDVR